MLRFLIGCAALTLTVAPAAAQYYHGGGYHHAPRYQEHYVAPKPKPYYGGGYHHSYKPKPKYHHQEYHAPRGHYVAPSYGGQYNPRY